MKVFLSWSGETSQAVANALRRWLPLALHYCEPWLSTEDINAGGRWALELGKSLETTSFGILCLTKQNINSDWLLFEAGALSKSLSESSVVPYLYKVDVSEVSGPISQFQAKKADKHSTLEVLLAINAVAPEPTEIDRVKELFEALWPDLQRRLNDIPEGKSKSNPTPRSKDQVLEDLVVATRDTLRKISEFEFSVLSSIRRLEGGANHEADGAILPVLRHMITEAEQLTSDQPSQADIETAKSISNYCRNHVKELFINTILSEVSREDAKSLLARAETILAFPERETE